MQTVEQKLKQIISLYDSRKFVESQKLCDEILAEDNKNTEAFRYKCKNLIGLGKYSEVNRIANEAAKTNPDAKFVLYYQGVSLYEMSRYQASLPFFEKAIELYPDWDFPYNGYGRSLEAVGRNEEAIKNFQKSFDLDPTDPGPLNLIGNNLKWRGKLAEALPYYNKSLEVNPDHILTLCNRGELLSSLGRNKEALEDFKRVQKLVDGGQIDARLNPGNMEFINTTLKAIVQLDNLVSETEANIQKADQNNPVVKRMIEHVKLLAKQKDQATTQLIAKKDDANSAETQKLMQEMERIKQEFSALNAEVINLRADVKKLESKYDEIKNELETKMDDFYKKLDNELNRSDVLPEDQTKIKEYFKAFIETFSSIHVTSQVVDSGQVKLDAVNTKATLLSMVASFTPFIGNILSTGIKSLTEFIQSREMKINARKMKGLASDASALSQLIGKAGYQIVLDKPKQKQICTITKQDLDKLSGTTLQRVIKFCENLVEDFDSYMYTNLYPTPAARLGHIDANDLIEGWINEKIDRYGIVEDFVKKTTTPKESKNDANSASPKEITPVTRSSCCNMF